MPSRTVENYIRNIYLLADRAEHGTVTVEEIADSLDLIPGTVSSIVSGLAKAELVTEEPPQTVRLTSKGKELAVGMIRRHRLLEYFLAEVLKMNLADVHHEAETLEHAVSDRLLEHLDAFLGEPRFDPHGDPIPTREGHMHRRHMHQMTHLTPGQRAKVAHIADQQPDFLEHVRSLGLLPGTPFKVSKVHTPSGVFTIEIPGQAPREIGLSAAGKIWVEL
ncbi:metal-dependent transcriptional regulator [Ruficoccus amylovorans]|uniref:Transcriptional regulator MntR n=1 Tax=Ruficoccus amylovorans TaxID=1804625 RepID=A0A842HC22_9BACT|nr:metal-dependent transcriptional regulator [Ruficoccus amylovorans]MBC2592961.1 metal-dependent transcriptional regulator [Ruficoccus amylovorans]